MCDRRCKGDDRASTRCARSRAHLPRHDKTGAQVLLPRCRRCSRSIDLASTARKACSVQPVLHEYPSSTHVSPRSYRLHRARDALHRARGGFSRRGYPPRSRPSLRSSARRGLRHRGLCLAGRSDARCAHDPRRSAARGSYSNVRTVRASGSRRARRKAPPRCLEFGPVHPQQTLVEIDLALPISSCSPERAQAAFGPFSAAPRRTGNPAFDQRFGVFVREQRAEATVLLPRIRPRGHLTLGRRDLRGLRDARLPRFARPRGPRWHSCAAVSRLIASLDTATALAAPHVPRSPARPPSLRRPPRRSSSCSVSASHRRSPGR